MFVLCVLSKDNRQNADNQDKERQSSLLMKYRVQDNTNRITVGARFSAPVLTGTGAHTASCTMGNGSHAKGWR
jgi:hypothetical protein